MKTIIVRFFLVSILLPNISRATSLSAFWKACVQNLIGSPFAKPDGWFSPQFKKKGDAERWLYSMVPRGLSATENELLTEWSVYGYSIKTNKILRSNQVADRGTEVIIPSARNDLTVNKIVEIFEGIHERTHTDRRVTVYRAVGGKSFEGEPNVGDPYNDDGLGNVTLEERAAIIHGENRTKKDNTYIMLVIDIPKGYPVAPTLDSNPYRDTTGKLNNVSVELEMTLPPQSHGVIKNKYRKPDGTLVLEITLSPSKSS
jgi:hypothetical protein